MEGNKKLKENSLVDQMFVTVIVAVQQLIALCFLTFLCTMMTKHCQWFTGKTCPESNWCMAHKSSLVKKIKKFKKKM